MAARKSVLDKETIIKKLSDAGVDDIESVIKELEAQVNKSIKQSIKDAQPYENEAYNGGEDFNKVYPYHIQDILY